VQAGEQRRCVRRFRRREERAGFDHEAPASARGVGDHLALQVLEATLTEQPQLVAHVDLDIVVEQVEDRDLRRRRDQRHARPHDQRTLPEPREHGVEQIRTQRLAAHDPLPLPRHNLELDHIVRLNAEGLRRTADATHRQRAADRQILIVREHGWCEALRQGRLQHRSPVRARPRVDPGAGARGAELHVGERAGIDHDARLDLRLTKGRVTVAAHRDL